MKQVSQREKREAENRAPQVEVVADAIPRAPVHRRKQAERFEDVSENDNDQASRAKQLQNGSYGLSSKNQDGGAEKQQARRHQRDQRRG